MFRVRGPARAGGSPRDDVKALGATIVQALTQNPEGEPEALPSPFRQNRPKLSALRCGLPLDGLRHTFPSPRPVAQPEPEPPAPDLTRSRTWCTHWGPPWLALIAVSALLPHSRAGSQLREYSLLLSQTLRRARLGSNSAGTDAQTTAGNWAVVVATYAHRKDAERERADGCEFPLSNSSARVDGRRTRSHIIS